MNIHRKKRIAAVLSAFLFISIVFTHQITVHAALNMTAEQLQEAMEERKLLPIQSDSIKDWPQGPQIGAQGAILMDADSGAVLYAKNIHERLYPASTTKILTSLVALEHVSNLNELVEFSHDAVFSVGPGATSLGIDVGEKLTFEQCLYGILVHSANEVCNAVGEHIAGSMEAYAELMNQKARELGCTDSNFVTLNGLHDEDHYTSPYDLALIAKAFFSNELLAKISGVSRYYIPQSEYQPDDDVYCNSHDLLLPGRKYAYDYIIGGKTGYTDDARQTLVSCAEKDGMRLICVIMKEESPNQFTDTQTLYDWGFSNFHKVSVSEEDTRYQIDTDNFFQTDNDIFGSSKPLLSMDPDSTIILPINASYEDTVSSISYDTGNRQNVAEIRYTYNDAYVGSAYITLAQEERTEFDFGAQTAEDLSDTATSASENTGATPAGNGPNTEADASEDHPIFINVVKVILWILGIAAGLFLLLLIITYIRRYLANRRRRRRRNADRGISSSVKRKKRRKRRRPRYSDYDYKPNYSFNNKKKGRKR